MNAEDWSYWVGRIARVWPPNHPLLYAFRRGIAVHHSGGIVIVLR
jgi:hypothetical protein